MCYSTGMDKEALQKLYNDVCRVLFDATLKFEDMTHEQIIFARVFERTVVNEEDVMETYSDFVDSHPAASLTELHSYCLAASLGKRYQDAEIKIGADSGTTTH